MPILARAGAAAARGFGMLGKIAAAVDEYFKYVTLLLPGNGTNGAQNNTFLDSSTNNFTITRNGNTTQGTFSPYGSLWSNYFDGSGDFLDFVSSTNATNFGTGDFTVEFWVYLPSVTSQQNLIDNLGGAQNAIYVTGGTLYWYVGANRITGTSALSPNVWQHISLCRASGTTRLFVNGTQVGSNYSDSNNYAGGTTFPRIGAAFNGTVPTNGYISNVRVVKGTALYTTTFTPSTSPLTAITNTSLLTCQSNRFIDNSTNAFTITVNGETSVQRFSPFNPTAPYAAGTDGGSGYFDGSGDYLTTPTSSQFTASGNFTVSCWFMLNSFANSYYVVGGNWDAGTSDEWLIQIQNNGAIRFLTSASTSFSSSGVVKLNEWTFFSATRSGSTVTVQVNGTTVSTYTKSDTLGSATKSINIGQQPGNNWPWNGYISDFRLVSGSAVTTLPTSPLTAISGTGLLLNFTNAGIIDNAEMNNLETVGNAQISTAQSKFGGASMAFDGTGDWIASPANPNVQFGTGDFTVEAWVYRNGSQAQFVGLVGLSGAASAGWFLSFGASNVLTFGTASGTVITSSSALTNTAWVHVAVSRSGTSLKMFFDGVQVASATDSTSFTDNAYGVRIGGSSGYSFNGYIDDLRITKGYARYTSSFTAPTAPFPLQ